MIHAEEEIPKPRKYSKPGDKFIKWKHCYGDEETDISLITAHATLIPTRYATPGIRLEMDVRFNKPLSELNSTFYNMELWHEQTGQKIKYRGPYDLCCGSIIANQPNSHSHVEYGCTLEESNCPITNTSEIYRLQMERPLYTTLDGTHEATFRVYQWKTSEHSGRREMDELLCVDIPFKLEMNTDPSDKLLWRMEEDESQSIITVSSGEEGFHATYGMDDKPAMII